MCSAVFCLFFYRLYLFGVFLDEFQDLRFVVAELFVAVLTGQAAVCVLGKSFGIFAQENLPSDQQKQGHAKQRPRIKAWDKDIRGEHHCKVPVIYAAIGAASALEEPSMEGTRFAQFVTQFLQKRQVIQ